MKLHRAAPNFSPAGASGSSTPPCVPMGSLFNGGTYASLLLSLAIGIYWHRELNSPHFPVIGFAWAKPKRPRSEGREVLQTGTVLNQIKAQVSKKRWWGAYWCLTIFYLNVRNAIGRKSLGFRNTLQHNFTQKGKFHFKPSPTHPTFGL